MAVSRRAILLKLSINIFTQDVADASVNNCCKLKLVFLEKRLKFSDRRYFEIGWGFYNKLKVYRQTSRDRDNGRRVRTHERNSKDVFADWAQ